MNRIDRLFGILTLLQSKKYVSAERISEKFGISIRTVYRDVKALCEQGIPVSFEQHKGYFIVKGYFLPPVSFTAEEANALVLMETMVRSFADKSIQQHYSTALNKMKAVMGYSQKEQLEYLDNNIKLQVPACMNNDFEHLSVLQSAIAAKLILEVDYRNNNGETSTRCTEPIGLIFYAFNWHLIAWCHMRREYRDFRVSRILKAKISNRPFEHKEHMALGDYMKLLPVDY